MSPVEAVRTDPLVGRVLDSRYTVLAQVARGGMATVYEALDARLDRSVAVKVMHPFLAEDPDFVARFTREARAAARISHPAVVAVHDQGTDRATGAVFLVMELIRGRTLRELLAHRGRLSAGEALEVLEPVAAALAAAHASGLVHRDVKPENVLLGDDGRILVADFGLARAVEASPLTAAAGLLIGTVAYLAPEQVSTGAADARSDVYSAGVLLFELVTGAPPYDGETPLSVAYRHLHDDVPSPRVHPALDALVLACTTRDPAARPRDGAALLRAVQAARSAVTSRRPTQSIPLPTRDTESLPAPEPPPPGSRPAGTQHVSPQPAASRLSRTPTAPPRSLQRRRRRRTGLIALLSLLLVTAAAAATGWWYGYGRWTSAPSVLSLTRPAAATALTADHLDLELAPPTASDTVPAGEVARQEPPSGARLHRGAAVRVSLSSGPILHAVPKVPRGTAAAQVGTALRAAGLGVGPTVQEYDETVPSGGLLRLNPGPGAQLVTGRPVTLVISQGPRPVPVPALTGKTRADALAALTAARLTGSVQEVFSDTVPAGTVVAASAAPGTTLLPQASVVLQVSKGPELILVPDVRGKSGPDARAILEGLGLRVASIDLPDGTGQVVTQTPRAQRVRRGTTVRIFVL